MAKITYIEFNGTPHEVEVPSGLSVMEGAADHLEKDMLECAIDLQETSRLSCQIEVSDELDGLVVRMPELQI